MSSSPKLRAMQRQNTALYRAINRALAHCHKFESLASRAFNASDTRLSFRYHRESQRWRAKVARLSVAIFRLTRQIAKEDKLLNPRVSPGVEIGLDCEFTPLSLGSSGLDALFAVRQDHINLVCSIMAIPASALGLGLATNVSTLPRSER